VLDTFIKERLVLFGTYQDAMTGRDAFLFHARISFALNAKIISPQEVVQSVTAYYRANSDSIGINQVEGFVRQVIGWREFMRGIYWAKMPEFAALNKLEHEADLPAWYWTGETKMKCLAHSIGQSLTHAYAHHIQRLMVTGNFALLLGVDPDEVDAWYLGIYIDAIEWVEITNTRGMSQFADGGIVGTKPYMASANYINKMSDYCGDCHYDRKLRHGVKACPFNSLYWAFVDRHRERLARNGRIGQMVRLWDRMEADEREATLAQAAFYTENADSL
jgi:deoxyribodipyrimidine photolyase-related protein